MAVGALRSLNAKSSELLNASGKVWSKCDRNVPSSNAAKGAFAVLPKTQFVDEEGLDDSVMAEGEVVVMRDETGEELHGVVIGVSEEEVEVDFNHPLAGIDLHFTVQLMGTERT